MITSSLFDSEEHVLFPGEDVPLPDRAVSSFGSPARREEIADGSWESEELEPLFGSPNLGVYLMGRKDGGWNTFSILLGSIAEALGGSSENVQHNRYSATDPFNPEHTQFTFEYIPDREGAWEGDRL